MNENLSELRKINNAILFSNETLNNSEKIAGFESWKINTVTKKFTISDNFYRLLGTEPNAITPSLDTIMEFVHPEDREKARKVNENSYRTKEATTLYYRYLWRDGTIRYMISVGHFSHNAKGELIKIVVSQNSTELMKKTKQLEENNTQLSTINLELELFNNIVRHDLKEPLRKILMFISRIENKEFIASSSESTLVYLDKIKWSAQRMQNLIFNAL
jgi:hypothetical protein